MFHKSPRVLISRIVALFLAIATIALVTAQLQELRAQKTKFGRIVNVVVARRDVPAGSVVTPSDLRTEKFHEQTLPEGALRSTKELINRVVVSPMLEGQVVVDRALADADRSSLNAITPTGFRTLRVPLGTSVEPEPGDRVDLIVSFDPQVVGEGFDPAFTVARAALVISVDRNRDEPGITLRVTEDEVPKVAFAITRGTVSVVVAPPEATDNN